MMLTLPQFKLLVEAGMSRRDFIKLFGKSVAAMYGAPVEKLASLVSDPLKSVQNTKNVQNIKKFVLFSDTSTGVEFGGEPPSLSWCINNVENAFRLLVKLTGSSDIGSYGDFEVYSFGVVIDENQLSDILKMGRLEVKDFDVDRGCLLFKNSDLMVEPLEHVSLDQMSSSVVDPVKQWVSDFAGNNMVQYIQTPEDVVEFENRGLGKLISKDARSEVENAIKRVVDEYGHGLGGGVDGYSGREVGYERRGQFDPQFSRPVQALTSFESRLLCRLGLV